VILKIYYVLFKPVITVQYAYILDNRLIEEVYTFLKKHLLHWFEALSLLGKIHESIHMLSTLRTLVQVNVFHNADLPTLVQTSSHQLLFDLVHDAYRFSMSNCFTIQEAPLQTYCSALIFSPSKSIVRRLFEGEFPGWLKVKPLVSENWDSLFQTLAGHLVWVQSVAFSLDGLKMVS
jgi:hypothetical protein